MIIQKEKSVEDIREYYGQKLKRARIEKGYSRKTAAQLLDISPRALAAYERGERSITMKHAKNMVNIYGLTFAELTGRENVGRV